MARVRFTRTYKVQNSRGRSYRKDEVVELPEPVAMRYLRRGVAQRVGDPPAAQPLVGDPPAAQPLVGGFDFGNTETSGSAEGDPGAEGSDGDDPDSGETKSSSGEGKGGGKKPSRIE